MASAIHPTAIVEPGAELGEGVTIGAYSIVGPHVKLGDRSTVGPHCVISGHTSFEEENEISPFASIGAPPQDLKFKGERSTLVIGKRNKIREFVTLQPGTAAGTMTTTIGDSNLFMANSHVAHDCRVGNNNVFANSVALAGHVSVRNNVILGGMAGIHQFCRVGDFTMISAGSMVAQDIPPYCMVQGDRACLRGLNVIGLERAGMTVEEIAEIKRMYRHLFSRPGRVRERIASLPEELASKPKIKYFLEFISESKRGIISPARHSNE